MFKTSIRGIPELTELLKGLPRGVKRVALKAFGEYIIGTPQRGLKRYQPYKHVTRRQAYGKPFKSDKQRRYVMAAIREGRIDPGVPHRTGRTQRGYRIVPATAGGYQMKIENPTAGAYYTRDDRGQARLNALAGWRKASAVLASNAKGAARAAQAAINAYLKQKGR